MIAPPGPKNAAWLGGSILGSLSSFSDMWVTKEEFMEHGPRIISRCSGGIQQRS